MNFYEMSIEELARIPFIDEYTRLGGFISYHEIARTNELIDFYKSLQTENKVVWITCTVVFKRTATTNTRRKCEQEYRTRFLNKIKQQLVASPEKHPELVPFEDLYYYEYNEKSKIITKSKGGVEKIHITYMRPFTFLHQE